MIPLQLTLRNFLSYREATLDFRGLHTACICGPNGAGKSSLLEAISWAIWGSSRAATEDDVIHQGLSEARVDFSFRIHGNTYRVIRTRYRGQAMTLDFQVETEAGQFRPLTGKNLRVTQQLIHDQINLDYETFVNSAYLRQGRADEFMLKRPGERKQILADLLKLQHYDELAEKARDQARQLKGQVSLFEQQLSTIANQRQAQKHIQRDRAESESLVAQLQQLQIKGREQLQTLQKQQQQRQAWQQQRDWQQQQLQQVTQGCEQHRQELVQAEQQLKTLEALFSQETDIFAGYAQWQTIQGQEEVLANRFQAFQVVQAQRGQQQQAQSAQLNQLQQALQRVQLQLTSLEDQKADLEQTLSRKTEIEEGLTQLQQARKQLQHYEDAQMQAAPLVQRQQQLNREIDRATARLTARLDELRVNAQQFQAKQSRQPVLQEAVTAVAVRIEELDQLRQYQEQVREKGVERRTFMERLQGHQRAYEGQLAEIDQILRLLNKDGILAEVEISSELGTIAHEANGEYQIAGDADTVTLVEQMHISGDEIPACPLCDRPLDEHHRHLVLEKHKAKQEEILSQIWIIREQLAVSEREIQVLRQEYCEIETRLTQYGEVRQAQGQLQSELQTNTEAQQAFERLTDELEQVELQLRNNTHVADFHQEMALLDQTLGQLNYDERDHALARGWVDRWRWAEIKYGDIKQAQKRYEQVLQKAPELQQQLQALQQQIATIEAENASNLHEFDQQLESIGYSLEQHNQLRSQLRQAQVWQLKYQELQQARQQFPQVQTRVEDISQALQTRVMEQQTLQQQVEFLNRCLAQHPDTTAAIQQWETELQRDRQTLDEQLAKLGQLQQRQQEQEQLKLRQLELMTELQQIQQQHRVYQELAQAFGKNGIPALMIENILPQLETMTNQILARLSANQLHVQFVTHRSRAGKSGKSSKSRSQSKPPSAKAIETLDILIADARGTRPYETYSGGEAFRINFAIRLALARLLSQRSGTALQMLIVDEGFGTQDKEGIDRLIGAINAIADDFACILTITHMAYFRDAFQARIEVTKTETGSHLDLCV
ncbi:SMC family ATPase [filamentous cyanobacterium LEGE 11480]|uniref:Nuclease SbcCD subunit C n=1 Tax=Romeriopsis navalis LEGE 11480 TaxID=2777977 RepID=A0A928VN51_9CYAN|nr:SMC family ATPase [Romeriopsis navalis]MBE9029560.1 SMC family ATPase [Romeriopsis navalis LEGE 11480]